MSNFTRWCSNIIKVRWKLVSQLLSQFSWESVGERILKIVNVSRSYGQKTKWLFFSGTLCTYVGAAYCYRPEKCGLLVGLSICLSVCHNSVVSPATTAELIKMPFELRTRVGPGNRVLDGGAVQILPWEEAVLMENWRPMVKYRDILRSSVQNG